MQVHTVLGPIAPEELGPTLMHEHVLHDWVRDWPDGRVGDLRIDSYDEIVDDEDLISTELSVLHDQGMALVEMTGEGLGAMPDGMARVARRTGVTIVKSYGWYRDDYLPPYVRRMSTNALADHIVERFEDGVGDDHVPPGIIGELATGRGWMRATEERVFRAAARAQRRIGCSISTHTEHFGELARAQVDLLREEGVPPERIIVGHLGERASLDEELRLAAEGVTIEVDFVGSTHLGSGSDERRAASVAALVAAGFARQVTLSMNLSSNSDLRSRGGRGFAYLTSSFVPLLLRHGVGEPDIRTMLVDTPRRLLAY